MSPVSPAAGSAVLVVDPHPNFREVLKFFLGFWFPGVCVREAGSLREAVADLREHPPALVVADPDLADARGMAAVRICRRLAPQSPVLVCSNHDDRDREQRALAAGARGFVRKWQFDSEAVRAVLEDLLGRPAVRRLGCPGEIA